MDAGRGISVDRAWGGARFPRPRVNAAPENGPATGRRIPSRGRRQSEPSENIAARQDHVGQNGDPEPVLGNERDRHEGADDRQNGQDDRNYEDDGCRW